MLFRERFAVFCVLSFLGSLFFMGIFPSKVGKFSCEACLPYSVEVRVDGAVERPGTYLIEVGSSIGDVLALAGLKKTADRRLVYFKKKILGSCQVHVPEKNMKKSKKKKTSSSSIALTSYAI